MAKVVKRDKDHVVEFPDQKILPIELEHEVRKSFMEYAMSVIGDRALPDARDGMKPGQRRVLYAMFEENLTHDKQYKKSVTTVGNVLGRYHPHGDASVYGTLVRMAQDFSYRYTLVDGKGNFGSIDGDAAAAYRYTEARLERISEEMMRDINKDVVPWTMNFDNTRKEPVVLPSRFPNLLVNGATGIAVGMATNIPPHNLGEVIDGTIYFMDNPGAGVSELMQYIKGPDFPTGATIHGTAGIFEAYSTGRGRVMVRGKAEVEEDKNRIIITEIPYMVNKSELVKNIADQIISKRIEGVRDLRDESDKTGMRIVVECRHDANPHIVLNMLYKYTELESTFAVAMRALINNEPKILTLRQILSVYVTHQEKVVTNRVTFDLNKALRERHINEGYRIAIDNIDRVVEIIKGSSDTADAKQNLSDEFGLSDEQAQAVVQMTLGRLTGLERTKIDNRIAELDAIIADCREVLADKMKVRNIIKEDLLDIKKRFGDERRTAIEEVENEILIEDLIERHKTVITLTHTGYIKRQNAETYSAQRRGGKGIIGMTTKEEDFVEKVAVADSHSFLMLFTDLGRVHQIKAYRIPEAGRTAKGSNIVNIIDIGPDEKITAMLSVPDYKDASEDLYQDDNFLTMITQKGIIKRTRLSQFRIQRRGGKIALSLDEGDKLLFVGLTHGTSDIMIATRQGLVARFDEKKVTVVGRGARGVRAIRLRDGDLVAGACIIENDDEWKAGHKVLVVSEKGLGKKIDPDSVASKGRGIQGMRIQKLSDKTGEICGISIVREDQDIIMITDEGTIIRIPSSGIPVYSRSATGVILMRLEDERRIVNFAPVDVSNEEEKEENEDMEGLEFDDEPGGEDETE